jgi:hypothetical protein
MSFLSLRSSTHPRRKPRVTDVLGEQIIHRCWLRTHNLWVERAEWAEGGCGGGPGLSEQDVERLAGRRESIVTTCWRSRSRSDSRPGAEAAPPGAAFCVAIRSGLCASLAAAAPCLPFPAGARPAGPCCCPAPPSLPPPRACGRRGTALRPLSSPLPPLLKPDLPAPERSFPEKAERSTFTGDHAQGRSPPRVFLKNVTYDGDS